ncbi:MAG: flagellar biosynthetic protein FliO [Firmicutes bacterium]|nr:flagellar biosynthetic protein FliO [Bacillota bacterium]MDD4694436.1 flagellar biosynthetic protein FliO [Bacillota bacterium]
MDLTYILTWFGATIGVVGLIYLLYFVVSKKIPQRNRDLEILEALQLGNRQSIYLVRVKNRILTIGITGSGMQVLSQFDEASKEEKSPSIYEATPRLGKEK